MGWATNLAILANWLPKHGRGLFIGCFASSANTGDIIGTQIYSAIFVRTEGNWGLPFIITGILVIAFALINVLFMVEYPLEKGIIILERGHLL
jgi:sugar phosphate permease